MSAAPLGRQDLVAAFREAGAAAIALAAPGRGRTAERFAALWSCAARDVALGRLVEAHADALAIAADAGIELAAGTYGVWASEGPGSTVEATPTSAGLRLVGAKRYCTGAALVDGALVTARSPDGVLLVSLGRDAFGAIDEGEWKARAFAGTGSATVHFDVEVPTSAVLGGPGWYLERPGFWHGGVGVAACWAGGAVGLLDRVASGWGRRDPHSLAHLGAADAAAWGMAAVLDAAGTEIDAAPDDAGAAQVRARRVRHLIDQQANGLVDDLVRGAGPGPLAFDEDIERQVAEVRLYTRQSHGERDVEPLGMRRVDGGG